MINAAPMPAIRVHMAPTPPYSFKHFFEPKIKMLEIKFLLKMEMG